MVMAEKKAVCKVCGLDAKFIFRTEYCERYEVDLFHCEECEFVFADPVYWLDEVYDSPINLTDVGYVWRNQLASWMLSFASGCMKPGDKCIDYGSGYGLFVRLMRDRGFDYRWSDPHCENLFARGFEADIKEVKASQKKFRIASAFEVFEHVEDPRGMVKELSELSDAVFFSTQLWSGEVKDLEDWWYLGKEHGQHISFHSQTSLRKLGQEFGWEYALLCKGWHYFYRPGDPILKRLRLAGFAGKIPRLNHRFGKRYRQLRQDYIDLKSS